MRVKLRTEPGQNVLEIEYEGLLARVEKGELGPDAECQLFADQGWERLDDLPLFHRYSPKDYPPGPMLEQHLRKAQLASLLREKRKRLLREFVDGTLVEEQFKVKPVGDIARSTGAQSVGRCVFFPAFRPESIVTLVIFPERAEVELVQGRTSVFCLALGAGLSAEEIPNEQQQQAFIAENKKTSVDAEVKTEEHLSSFDPHAVTRTSCVWTANRFEREFLPLSDFRELAGQAGPCMSNTADGVHYIHVYCLGGGTIRATWGNPIQEEHPCQWRLSHAYGRVWTALGGDKTLERRTPAGMNSFFERFRRLLGRQTPKAP
jgi:hypothetical protein